MVNTADRIFTGAEWIIVIRFGITVETAGEQGGMLDRWLALAWTPHWLCDLCHHNAS